MATIGQQLLTPEAGWKRYDDRDTNISYVGTWTSSAVTGYYNNTNMDSNSTSSYYEFWFKGTKLRIIDGLASNRSADVKVTIDGVTESYSAYATTTTRGVLVYEKTGLTNGFHKVVVKNNTSNYMTLDAIDIDEDGVFRPSYNKFLILSNEKKLSVTNQKVSENISTPLMTSNTAPSGEVLFSSEYINVNRAFHAFNRVDGTYGWISARYNNTGYIGYNYPTPIAIGRYVVRSSNNSVILTYIAKDWTFEGSNDGTSWDILDTQINQTWNSITTDKVYDIGNSKKYKMYRLNITANNGHPEYVTVGQLKMYEVELEADIKYIDELTEFNFTKYGMNKSTRIDLNSQMKNKVFIEQNSTTLGNGKVFSKTIDTTKIPIKKLSIK